MRKAAPTLTLLMLEEQSQDRIAGALMGAAIGDALGMPIEGLSHQNVRTYYRGIKGLRADEKRRDLEAGQGTHRTQHLQALSAALTGASEPLEAASRWHANLAGTSLRRWPEEGPPPAGAAFAAATAIGTCWAVRGWDRQQALEWTRALILPRWRQPVVCAAAFAHASAIRSLIGWQPADADGLSFLRDVHEAVAWAETELGAGGACSSRLARLAPALDGYPLDLQDICEGTGPEADRAWPFAVAMMARNPRLVEANLLSAVNVGGDAPTIGLCVGGMAGALHGLQAFPPGWLTGLEAADDLEQAAAALMTPAGD